MLDTLRILTLMASFHANYLQDLRKEGIVVQEHAIEYCIESMTVEGRCDKNGSFWKITIDSEYPVKYLKMLMYHELTHAYFELPDCRCHRVMNTKRLFRKIREKDLKDLVKKLIEYGELRV